MIPSPSDFELAEMKNEDGTAGIGVRCRKCKKPLLPPRLLGMVKVKPGTTELAALPFACLGHAIACNR